GGRRARHRGTRPVEVRRGSDRGPADPGQPADPYQDAGGGAFRLLHRAGAHRRIPGLGGADVTAKWSALKLIAERAKETGARGVNARELESLSAVVEDLVRDGVLVREQQELWFSHEALFDQVIARSWAESKRPLVAALLATDQDLSHRSLVRQVLTY